jgi:hypothetical protein
MTERVLGTLPRRRRKLDHEQRASTKRSDRGGTRRGAADCPHGDVKRAIRGRIPGCVA